MVHPLVFSARAGNPAGPSCAAAGKSGIKWKNVVSSYPVFCIAGCLAFSFRSSSAAAGVDADYRPNFRGNGNSAWERAACEIRTQKIRGQEIFTREKQRGKGWPGQATYHSGQQETSSALGQIEGLGSHHHQGSAARARGTHQVGLCGIG
jgi:hypothetical protein